MDNLFLPLSIVFGLLNFGLIARWYLMPALASRPLYDALRPLLLFHAFRYVGLAFLIPGVTRVELASAFAAPAAYGDLIAAFLALVALLALRLRWAGALALVWIFNIEGLLDLLNAVYQGFRHAPDGDLGATYFIPSVIVPALVVSHFVMFRLLLARPAPATAQ